MKSKSKSKTTSHKRPPHSSSHSNPTAHQTHGVEYNPHANIGLKTCEDDQTGNFGSFDESFEGSNHCRSTATQFCSNCNMNVCDTHYNSNHRNHDNNFNSQRQGHNLSNQ